MFGEACRAGRWFRRALAATSVLAATSAPAAESSQDADRSALLKLLPIDGIAEPNHHILDAEKPAGRAPNDDERTVHSIYFPPNPPPLGVDLSLGTIDARNGAPDDLAPYVMEPFYAPLSTRVIERSLTRKQKTELDTYRKKKAALVKALRTRLQELANIDVTARRVALAAFAARQQPDLVALERQADDMRHECYTYPANHAGADWYSWRGWKLGRGRLDIPRSHTLFLEYQLLRAAAFYQEGLSPPQRRLLRECAADLEPVVFPGTTGGGPLAADWFWCFSPHLARVHLPDELPADLQAMIATYRADKSGLKTELRDAIYDNDRVVFESTRVAILEALAERQAVRLDALEQQAEKIRRRLGLVAPLPVPPVPAPLPADLSTMIDRYRAEKKALERELADRLRRAVRHMVVPGSYEPEPSLREWREARVAAIAEERMRFRQDAAERLAALRPQLAAIRTAIQEWQGTEATTGAATVGNQSFLDDFFTRRSQQQGQHDYHLAVFEPGLSPEQRRLLFGAAIVELHLPLPGPEDQPTSLPGTMLK